MEADGMDFHLTEEQEGLQRLARQIIQEELMPLEPRFLEEGRDDLWPEDYERLKKLSMETGLWGAHLPTEFGGSGMGVLGKVLLLEQFFQTAVAFPLCAGWMGAFLGDC